MQSRPRLPARELLKRPLAFAGACLIPALTPAYAAAQEVTPDPPALGQAQVKQGAAAIEPQNRILIVLADDLGVEQLSLYRPGAAGLASTPSIDEIASHGVTFRNAWVNPLCSPTRATIQTGRYACRTGIGHVVERQCPDYSLPLGRELPTQLAGCRTGAFGKWHLEDQTQPDLLAPWSHGYDTFEGHLWHVPFNCGPRPTQACDPTQFLEGWTYYKWFKTRIVDGQSSTSLVSGEYLPSESVSGAMRWIRKVWTEDWFCYLAPQAPFDVQHCPPAQLQSSVACSACSLGPCNPSGGAFGSSVCMHAVLEAFDTKIGDLLRGIEQIDPLSRPWWETTTIIFLGDNGTGLKDTGFWPVGQGKGQLYNGGIQVPLIVAGNAVPVFSHGARTEAVANGVDVYATVLELAGRTPPADIDGISLLPVLYDPGLSVREFVYSERFDRNGPGPHHNHEQVIADATYSFKLRRAGGVDSFFELAPDPAEPNGPKKEQLLCAGAAACANLPPDVSNVYDRLRDELSRICP